MRIVILLLLLILSPVFVVADGKPKSSWNNLYIIFIYIAFFAVAILVSMIIRRYRSGGFGTNEMGNGLLPIRAARGLNSDDIESLPSLRFSEIKLHKIAEEGQLECSVCLCVFKDQEVLRLLPDCLHVFHPGCIGPWLTKHVTCPVCRANVEHRQGSSVSTSSILERISGTYSERFDGISGTLSSDMYDNRHNDGDQGDLDSELIVEIEGSLKLEYSQSEMDGTRGERGLARCYSTGDLAVRFEGENSTSVINRSNSYRSEMIRKSPKLIESAKSDSFIDYSSLLFGVHVKRSP